jgi:hypothetical protein
MLFGVPQAVKSFFQPALGGLSKPIGRSLPVMVLALLMAPHRRCLKTLAGMVLGRREHGATISRRLRNRRWKTHAWYTKLYEKLWSVSLGASKPATYGRFKTGQGSELSGTPVALLSVRS